MQQRGPDDRLVATIASPQSLRNTAIYIDCSGDRGGKVAQGSFGSIYLGRTGSNDLYAVKLPVSGRIGDNVRHLLPGIVTRRLIGATVI